MITLPRKLIKSKMKKGLKIIFVIWFAFLVSFLTSCTGSNEADLIVTNGRVYTYTWDDPAADGTPAASAPFKEGVWHPDAAAVATRNGKIIFVGSNQDAETFRGANTRIIDVRGGTILPGLVDSHTHVEGIGANLERVDLTSAKTEEQAVKLIAAHLTHVAKGEWIIGYGWDEGAWAGNYPDLKLLSERAPDHPVVMQSLHSFAVWGNRLAFENAGITSETESPEGGEILKDQSGNPAGILLNRATNLLTDAIPAPGREQIKTRLRAGLNEMAKSGYVAVHEAGVGQEQMQTLEDLYLDNELPIRVYAMLNAREENLLRTWLKRRPFVPEDKMLIVRAVKAYYDGALGSRGARLLEDYSDTPGHRGVSGETYGFDQKLVAEMIHAGFQVGIHAIGDAGIRETLDFFERISADEPGAAAMRHRIEHSQVIHPDDFQRFAKLGIIASMQPPHAVEDKAWAEDRLGPERIKGAYAWRTLRKAGVRLIFNSDLTGSDHSVFYGLHSAITRRSKDLQPPNGWFPEQALTTEEAVRAYTVWPAYAAFLEDETGTLAPGKWADITVLSIDPHNFNMANAHELFSGKVLYTIVAGEVVYEKDLTSSK